MKFLSQLLKEFAVQSTSDYVFDTPSGEAGSLKIPISRTMFKRISVSYKHLTLQTPPYV